MMQEIIIEGVERETERGERKTKRERETEREGERKRKGGDYVD